MAQNQTTRRIIHASPPVGMPKETDFRLEEVGVPECAENGLLVRTTWISVDPYLRGRMSGNSTYIAPIPVGAVMESGCVGEVIESRNAGFRRGETVTGMWGWQEI